MCDPISKHGCTELKQQVRLRPNVYECPPPPPVVVRCSLCNTAERDGCNLWSCLPFVSYTSLCGPTLGDILVHVLNLLPLPVITWFGVGHEKTCRGAEPPVVCYDPIDDKDNNKKSKKVCPEVVCRGRGDRREERQDKTGDNLSSWMHEEYVTLARELSDLQRLTSDGETRPENLDLIQARHYVLDRLAEMLAKREEIERRIKKKKQRGLSDN